MEKNNKENKENEIREYYNSRHPKPSFINFLVGMVFFILCLANLYFVKIGTNNVLIVINFITVFFYCKFYSFFCKKVMGFLRF